VTTLAFALTIAADRIPVFPLHGITAGRCTCRHTDCSSPGKHPRTAHGLSDASTDPAAIRAWWERWPDANLGARTGTPGGIVVVDLDSLEAELRLALIVGMGPEALLEQSLLGGLLVTTGRGRHHWYRQPDGVSIVNSAGKLGPGLDVRGSGGYVVAPPSLHASGTVYAFGRGRLGPPPERLLAELTRVDPPAILTPPPPGRDLLTAGGPTTRYGRGVLDRRAADVLAAPDGTLNYSLLRAATTCAGYAATGEIDLDEARALLLETAVAAGHPARTAARTIESGFERGLAAPLHRPPSRVERLHAARSDAEVEEIMRDA
jgi:hypothetical protein